MARKKRYPEKLFVTAEKLDDGSDVYYNGHHDKTSIARLDGVVEAAVYKYVKTIKLKTTIKEV